TARSRTSGAYLVNLLLMAPSSQGLEPPGNPGRFRSVYAAYYDNDERGDGTKDRYERHAKFHRASPQARDAGALRVAGYPVPHPCTRAEAGLTRERGSSAGRDAARPATA